MSQPLHADRPLDPKTLSPRSRDTLCDALYQVQRQIFDGVDRETFRRYVVDSPAQRTRIQVFRSPEGEAVGFAAVHIFERKVMGRNTAIMRAEVGLLPAWRGRSAAGRLLIQEAMLMALRHPSWRRCFVACPVHPASYMALARNHKAVWPRPEQPTPAATQALMQALDVELGLERPQGAGSLVRKVGWITRQDAAEAEFWARHSDPLVRFYTHHNPGYVEGQGLLILATGDARSVLSGLQGLMKRQLSRARRELGRLLAMGWSSITTRAQLQG